MKQIIVMTAHRIHLLLLGFFLISADSVIFAQSFLDSEDRLERFRLKALNLKTQDCRGFWGYQSSLLSSFNCPRDPEAEKKTKGFVNLSWIMNEQSKRKLVGSFPADFPVFHESFYFGSQGEPRVSGSSGLAEVSIQSQPFSNLAFAASFLGLHDFENGSVAAQIQKLYFETSFRSLIFSFGRQPLFWGQSFVNPILIGDSAQNMDTLRLSTKPFRWGGFLNYLGDLKAEFFLSRMEEDRATPREWFMGWRVGLMPTEKFEINFSYLYQ
ncbi:MAG: capsule assembly Wzi family protein, partial [Bdellovibrionota bacterium]